MSWSIDGPTVTARDSLETRTDHDHDGLLHIEVEHPVRRIWEMSLGFARVTIRTFQAQ